MDTMVVTEGGIAKFFYDYEEGGKTYKVLKMPGILYVVEMELTKVTLFYKLKHNNMLKSLIHLILLTNRI